MASDSIGWACPASGSCRSERGHAPAILPIACGRIDGAAARRTEVQEATVITSIHIRRLHAALPLAGALMIGTAAMAAEAPPTPMPRPGGGPAVDGAVKRSIAVVPRPQLSPDRAPTPASRPDENAQGSEAPAAGGGAASAPSAAPPVAVAPPVEAAPLGTVRDADARDPAAEDDASTPAAAASPVAKPPSTAAAEAPPAPETGPIGPPPPGRDGPANLPLARPHFDAPPKPPLDDQSVAAREAFGPPKANPLMVDRLCRFSPAAHAVFALKPEIETEEGCAVVNPVRLESVGDDPKISFADPPILSCAFANVLADFLVTDVQKLAVKHLESPVVEVGPGTSYACRGRNNETEAKLSEHAFGNAFDLQALRLADGTFLTVVGGWSTAGPEKDFWREAQTDACARFKTVLGPDANKLHEDHFHLDMARRKRGYALCE